MSEIDITKRIQAAADAAAMLQVKRRAEALYDSTESHEIRALAEMIAEIAAYVAVPSEGPEHG
jgi:hypothetical protein